MDDNLKLNKALQLLSRRGLDGLIVYSSGTRHILRPSYFHYFSGLKPMGPNNAVIISKNGKAALLVEPPWDSIRASEKTWVSDVRGSRDFVKEIASTMREFKIEGSVGMAGLSEMTDAPFAGISGVARVEPADDIIEEIARVKTPGEIDIVREAARIADAGFNSFLENVRVGIKEYELAAEAGFAMRAAGADDIFILMSSEKHNQALHTPLDKRLTAGDIIIFEMAPFCDGQCVQVCRTIVLGTPHPVLTEKYRILMRAFEESLTQIRPGLPASLMSITMNRVISEAGYAKYCAPPYMRARGHGFGVGSIAPGAAIDNDTKVNLEPHQVLVTHPNQYFPETGYLACGETVLVTGTGMERLLKTGTRLYVKEG